jgi:hypothetical protein
MGFIASAYLNFVQYQHYQSNQQQANGTITDLRYQLGINKSSPSPSPDSSVSVATPTPSPAVLGDQTTPTPTPAAPAAPTATATVINGGVKLRAQPSIQSQQTGWVPSGSVVTLGSYKGPSYQEITWNGLHGYVSTAYLQY